MEFAHSFWSKPMFLNKFNYIFEIALLTNLVNYAYSVSLIHKFGYKITLYADKIGAELLSFIPYDNVVILDIDPDENIHFAASIKFYALLHMKLHDVLIDGDLFLEKQIYYDFYENSTDDIIYSFYEAPRNFLSEEHEKVVKLMMERNLKYTLNNVKDLEYPNTSCMQINSLNLKDDYINLYFDQKKLIEDIDFKSYWPDITLEQYMLRKLVEDKGYTYKPVIENFPNNHRIIEALGYVHLGYIKYDIVGETMIKLKNIDPELALKLLDFKRDYLLKNYN